MSLDTVPPVWRALLWEINGDRPPDGTPGLRDAAAPCEHFLPSGEPRRFGLCETDGHYLCIECAEIDRAAYRRRHSLCEDCGAPLARERTVCSARCDGGAS